MLSIIICTYNRERYIYNVLKSLAENVFPKDKYEIILVNNNCTDATEKECLRFEKDFRSVSFRIVYELTQGLSSARNKGIREARGDILIYVDDDATVNKNYLKAYSDFFEQNQHSMAAGGAIIPMYESHEPSWFSYYTKVLLTGYLYYGDKIKEFPNGKFPGGGNAAYRKEVFDRIGLFNVQLGRKGDQLIGAEEKDIFEKMRTTGLKFYYIPDAILFHIIPSHKLTREYFNRLTFSIGQSERMRTLGVSKNNFFKRILLEIVKWIGSVVLFAYYVLKFQIKKGLMILLFRWNVTKGLLIKTTSE